jgi:hypothetical protein
VQLDGFDEAASAQHLRSRFSDANDAVCLLFHENSAGNPRSQFYVLDPARADAVENGSDAAQQASVTPRAIFDDLVDAAIKHVADPQAARTQLADLRAHDRISGGGLVGVLNLVAWLMRQRSLSAIGC